MVEEHLLVGLVVDCIAPSSPWASHAWLPAQVLPAPPETPAWTLLARTPEKRRYYAGSFPVSLYSTETANYQTNLLAGPRLWVVLRPQGDEPPCEVVAVTADPAEGEAFTEPGTDVVETVAMPPEIAAAIIDFVQQHHVERPFFKRRRDSKEMDEFGPSTAAGATPPGRPAKE